MDEVYVVEPGGCRVADVGVDQLDLEPLGAVGVVEATGAREGDLLLGPVRGVVPRRLGQSRATACLPDDQLGVAHRPGPEGPRGHALRARVGGDADRLARRLRGGRRGVDLQPRCPGPGRGRVDDSCRGKHPRRCALLEVGAAQAAVGHDDHDVLRVWPGGVGVRDVDRRPAGPIVHRLQGQDAVATGGSARHRHVGGGEHVGVVGRRRDGTPRRCGHVERHRHGCARRNVLFLDGAEVRPGRGDGSDRAGRRQGDVVDERRAVGTVPVEEDDRRRRRRRREGEGLGRPGRGGDAVGDLGPRACMPLERDP